MDFKPNRYRILARIGLVCLGWAASFGCSATDKSNPSTTGGQTGSGPSSSTATGMGGSSSTSSSVDTGSGTTSGATSTGAGGASSGAGGAGAGGATGGSGGTGGLPPPDGGVVDDPSPRIKFNFNVGWKFIRQDVMGAQAPAFDDTAWANVSTPHTFNDVDTYSHLTKSEADGEKAMWTGKTWYRKHFTVPAELANRKVFIEFEGVRQRGRVYLNGVDVGMNEMGFIPFGFDLTANIKFGQDNVLAVLCDNTFPMNAEGSSDPLVWHDSHWHPNFGGIYRNVYLHVTDKTHVTLPLYSNLKTSGVFARATNVSNTSAAVAVDAEVMNEDAAAKTVDFEAKVMDAQGAVALTLTDQQMVAAGKSLAFSKTAMLANPKLWEPASPHLYRVQVTLKSAGTTLDVTSVPLGIRYWKFDLTSGLTMNGKHLKLHGWGQKPTNSWAGLGAATPEWMHEYTMRMQKAANSNFMRWAHCAGSPGNLQFSDKYGIIVLQPGVDAEGDAAGVAWTTRANAWRSMVTYFRNNPSILIWEGGNQATKTSVAHIMEIKQITAQLDPTRTFAFRRENPMIAQYFDISIGTEAGNDAPSLPVVEGEYGRWESPRRVWDALSPPSFGYNIAAADMTPGYAKDSEQFAVAQVSDWAGLKAAGHSGGANFHFTDEPTHRRVFIEVARNTGEVDANRLPKEAYYVVKAMWSEQPQVHIVGHWNYPANTTKDVFVASNGDTVELFVNGTSIGKNSTPSDTYLFTFKAVKWAAGSIRAVAYKGGTMIAQQEKKTAGDPFALKLTAATGPDGLRADGADFAIVDVEVVDKDGNRCPTDQARVDFTVSGPAVWRGGYNSGKANSTNNTYLDTEAGINRVFVRSTLMPGSITVNATRTGLMPGSVKVDSVPVAVTGGLSRVMPAFYTTGP
jgi:beta-galactosidase